MVYNIYMALILGIDEVGRGSWAGPLAVGAVVLDSDNVPEGLKDSKQLSKKRRETLSRSIKESAVAIGVGWVDAYGIDRLGLTASLKSAALQAFEQILLDVRDSLDQIVIDGTINFLNEVNNSDLQSKITTMPKADDRISAVSAASIVAKVFRDHYMVRLDAVFPNYHFGEHVGYGTALHRECLQQFGVIPGIHRESFSPVEKLLQVPDPEKPRNMPVNSRNIKQNNKRVVGRTSRELGYQAETVAANYLEQAGHKIVARNWKTKFCEIDIISICGETLYFNEVKFREKAAYGNGLDAVTKRKLNQMEKAAQLFLSVHNELTKDFSVQLAAISLSDNPPKVDEFIENII